ncbi:MAG: leucine-rich repeat domain-containing protein, partial [Clostridiales bacterium]|nr:leucine-rich repeat domain-containing protein [Clostridiales bacterium]
SPLADKEHLIDANLCRNRIADFRPLLSCKNLKRLWIGNCGLSDGEVAKLRQTLPDCKINTTSGADPTGAGWRKVDRYFMIKAMFSTHVYKPFF